MADIISEDRVRAVAKLARLNLADSEISEFSQQLGSILGYIEKMNELDTSDVSPLAHCLPVSNRFREDVPAESLTAGRVLDNAPDQDGRHFLVPRILDEDSSA